MKFTFSKINAINKELISTIVSLLNSLLNNHPVVEPFLLRSKYLEICSILSKFEKRIRVFKYFFLRHNRTFKGDFLEALSTYLDVPALFDVCVFRSLRGMRRKRKLAMQHKLSDS